MRSSSRPPALVTFRRTRARRGSVASSPRTSRRRNSTVRRRRVHGFCGGGERRCKRPASVPAAHCGVVARSPARWHHGVRRRPPDPSPRGHTMSSAAAVATDLDLLDLDLLDLDRFAREGPPFAEFARLTREAPVWWHAARRASAGFWVVTGYDEIVSLGRRPAELSSDADHGGVTGLGAGDELQDSLDGLHDRVRRWSSYGLSDWLGGDGSTSLATEAKQLLTMDPPEHTAFRKMVNRGFTPRMIATLRPKIERTVAAAFDRLPMDEPFDLVDRLAMPIPLHMIADMLGVPPEDHHL